MKWAAAVLSMLLLAGCTDGSSTDGPSPTTAPPLDVGLEPTPSATPSAQPSPSSSPSASPRPSPRPSGSSGPQPEPEAEPEPEPDAPHEWPDLSVAKVRPGVRITGGCTSNFVFTSPHNGSIYIGTAAHCVADAPDSTHTDGCDTAISPHAPGVAIDVEGANVDGRLVYNSWHTMQHVGESSADTCRYNDFAVVELDAADLGNVHPALRHYGGPTGLCASAPGAGGKVLTYGNSDLRFGLEPIRPREGYVVFTSPWTTSVYTVSPGVPGDSGSAVIAGDGCALGILVTLQSVPPAGNGVTTLARALEYAAAHGWDFELATWDLLDAGLLP